VKPKAGFGRHPHRNAEIFSYVVKGELSHQDSMGNKESLGRGGVQYLSAGTGVTHSGSVNLCVSDDCDSILRNLSSKFHFLHLVMALLIVVKA
jgi:hypothetical protein